MRGPSRFHIGLVQEGTITNQRWRDVWDETRTAMKHLEASMEVVRGLEHSEMVAVHARICSDGMTKTLALMRESIDQVRRHVHAVDVQLSTAVEAIMFHSILDEKEKV